MGMCMGTFTDMGMAACIGKHSDVRIDAWTDIRADICTETRAHMCTDVCG